MRATSPRGCRSATCIAETNRIHLVLFGMQNRTCGPYLAAIHRFLISIMIGRGVNGATWIDRATDPGGSMGFQ
jgi:hypothetical protein